MPIKEIQEDIVKVARACGRNPEDITLLAVSKNVPPEVLLEAYHLGQRDFGESRLPEAMAKMEALPYDIRWHFIGRIQSNKVTKLIGRFALIHSVDSVELAQHISKATESSVTSILLQVNTSGELSKAGFTPAECRDFFAQLEKLPGIEIKGLMTMAPLTEDGERIRDCFRKLRELRDELFEGPAILSMGMSHDYKIAIQEGATLLRIGTSLFQA